MDEPQFRVTVEDLTEGTKQTMEFYPGDYVLIPFAPCHRASIATYPVKGTHVITIRDYRPQGQHREVDA